jgi:hypothetical protein
MSTGLCRITGKESFCVMKVFYDGSYGEDEKSDKWITFAGIAGTDALWAEFDLKWDKMLKSRYPIAPYVHMIELMGDEDPFEPLIGWDFENKRQLIQDAIQLMSHMKKAEFRMAWSSINQSALNRLRAEGLTVPADPILHVTADCVFATIGAYASNVPDEVQEPMYVFFDRGEKFLKRFKDNWLKFRTKPGRPKDPENWMDCFADVQEVDLPNHFGLQAADMIAWGNSRSLSVKERPFSWLKEWLVKCVPSTSVEYSEERLQNLKQATEARRGWERLF